jgi:hypothetical protein
MWLLILEAAAAFFIFVFIVWWTMFSGRRPDAAEKAGQPQTSASNDDTDQPKSM